MSEIESINSEDEASAPEEARETNVAEIAAQEDSFESNMIRSEDNESRCRTIIEEKTSEVVADSAPPSSADKKNGYGSAALQEVLTFSADSHEQEEQSFLAGKILSAVQ